MNLKESFRYHNYLDKMLDAVTMYLTNRDNVVKTEITHFRHKANPEAEDETLDQTPERTLPNLTVEQIVSYYLALADEKFKLTQAVEEAKRGYEKINYDAALVCNKRRQNTAACLRRLSGIKECEMTGTSRDYKFNANGEQVPYVYETKIVTTIDFDRTKVRKLAKQLTDEANLVSDELDHALLSIEVAMEPAFDITESLEESIESFFPEKEA